MTYLHGKKIWLVGASVGIGEALALRLARSGATLALSARSEDKLKRLNLELAGTEHLVIPLDVTDLTSVKQAWDTLGKSWQKIDIVIYNAGCYEPMNAQQFDLTKTEQMLDVNFRGALRVLDAVLPEFTAHKRGHIVLVASVAAYCGLPNAVGYGASKAALLHLSENLRLDLANSMIKVQVVSPGFVKTRLTEKNDFEMPFIITPELAAEFIERGMCSDQFEIHFPKRFTYIMKALRLLPYQLLFPLLKKL